MNKNISQWTLRLCIDYTQKPLPENLIGFQALDANQVHPSMQTLLAPLTAILFDQVLPEELAPTGIGP